MKILSISIAAYNAEKWLETCLNSFVIPKILEDIEVLIINDGSTDGTAEIAREYVSKYPDTFILINKENGGHGSTINTGIKAATGKYFKLVDADDWVTKEGIIDLVKIASCCSTDAIISPYYKFCVTDRKMQLHNIFQYEFGLATLTFKTSLLKNNFTEITEKCFFVDMEYDVFYSCYISNVFVSNTPVYVYRVGNGSQSVALANMVKRRDQHLIVVNKLLDFYCKVTGKVPEANLQIVKKTIRNLLVTQIYILFGVDDKIQSKEELCSFIDFIKSNYFPLYKETIKYGLKEKNKTIILVSILDKLHFHFYGFIHKMVHLHMKGKI